VLGESYFEKECIIQQCIALLNCIKLLSSFFRRAMCYVRLLLCYFFHLCWACFFL